MPTLNGTTYRDGTPESLMRLFESLRESGQRIRFYYEWHDQAAARPEECDTVGTIGRSMGPRMKVPILLANSRSVAGTEPLTDHIVRVDTSPKGRTLWRRP